MRKNNYLTDENSELRVAFPYFYSANSYDPINITLAPQYALLENLYSPLIELSPKGDLQSSIAEDFNWVDNELQFKIRSNLKTIDGYIITAKDVEFSLKRLMVLTGNSHGNLKDILCPDVELKNITDNCPNLEVRNDNLVIFKPEKKDVFLVKMLTAIDFAIIPEKSVDKKTLKIIDYRNTSGPYYVEKDSDKGDLVLAANKLHYHYSKKIPQIIKLVPTPQENENNSLEDYKANKVDFITEADSIKSDKITEYAKSDSNSTLHATANIRMYVASFTQRGLQKFTDNQRFILGNSLKKIYNNIFLGRGLYQESYQFFPTFGEGGISEEDKTTLSHKYKDALDKIEELPLDMPLRIGYIRMGDMQEIEKAFKEKFKNAKFFETKRSLVAKLDIHDEQMPDIVLAGPDTGFLEDIGLISYTLNMGILGLPKKEASDWLKDYMENLNKTERIKKLQQLHFESLIKPSVIPLISAPYVALVRKPWKSKLPNYFANNSLWLLEKE
ncbi:MAG: ABC transporter substrate-binding protein [Pseudobdellovibrio sp.]